MEHEKYFFVNVGFCIMYILNKWIQLQYGGKNYSIHYSFLHTPLTNHNLKLKTICASIISQEFHQVVTHPKNLTFLKKGYNVFLPTLNPSTPFSN
jgi:hypothetical protein